METLYHQTNALIQQIHQNFQHLETFNKSTNRTEIEKTIAELLQTINSNCEKLDILLLKVPVAQRPHAKMRCDQLKYDSRHLQAALESAQRKRYRQEQVDTEREQLLGTRFRANPESTAIDLDYAVQQQGAMERSHRGVDEILDTGANTLHSLRSQRGTLKGAKKRIVDMASNLGLSNHVMKLIERRAGEDKYILFGGMIITVLCILLVIIYWI